ncbi:G-rich sequence factor 1 [Leptonychotes weddellii]|uniref:G-rich sequence factor 1 n=1 Tax=Leptonychotes weddellii TaxID=9713 RepID=A0A7F8QFY7_LEPWE|nr:G-rich sequence factor 1 [Leptonychotes weddellii]
MNQQAKQVVTVLGVVIDPDYQGEIGLLRHSGDKEEHVWIVEDLSKRSYHCHILDLSQERNYSNPVQPMQCHFAAADSLLLICAGNQGLFGKLFKVLCGWSISAGNKQISLISGFDFTPILSDCRIRNGENGIHFLLNRDGKRRGDALIEMESEQDVQKALEKHRMYMGQRYVEVYEINNEDVDALMKSLQVKSSPVVNDGVVRLRGLPYSCNEKDIVDFFAGLNIVDITFVMDYRGRRKTGEAYVQFEEPEMANQALLKHREEIGNRYIEIFPSRRNEVRTHVGSHKGKKMASSPTAKYITEPEMVFEEHEVNEDIRPMTAFESEKEIELPKEMSEKLPEAVDFGTTSSLHFVHMRGLPFQANAQDIINFFAPLKPVRITMEYSSNGKATGEADVHFDTHEDAVAAMLKDRSHVHHRYIELFLNSCPKGK